MKIKTVQNAII